eukprot:2849938-Pyramimonas_sp.AAC.1
MPQQCVDERVAAARIWNLSGPLAAVIACHVVEFHFRAQAKINVGTSFKRMSVTVIRDADVLSNVAYQGVEQ